MSRSIRRVSARFVVVVVVQVLLLFTLAAVGAMGLQQLGAAVDDLYGNAVLTSQTSNDLSGRFDDAHELALGALVSQDPARRRELVGQLLEVVVPKVQVDLVKLDSQVQGDEQIGRAALARATEGWQAFVSLAAGGALLATDDQQRSRTAEQVTAILNPVAEEGHLIAHDEADRAGAANARAVGHRRHSLQLIAVVLALALALGVAVLAWLIRSVLPRTLAYSRFASRVADGDDNPMQEPTGNDEITQLGRALQVMAGRGRDRRTYESTRFEFTEALQLTQSEREAHTLLKRHLERFIPDSEITVLNRNNSADRLEAMTPVGDDSPLSRGLVGAKPRSCLAVRQARVHTGDPDVSPLVSCDVCSGCPSRSTCTPLLVGGEVIGAVLARHDSELDGDGADRIHESVVQAAPVLANLRNLAIAERRASTDALTGLPNKRAVADTLKRMVAQADRSGESLAVLMLDLDHFKQINDHLGHGTGDEVLAAVGAALRTCVRDSDFAGRYGGEEFIVLLSCTDRDGAVVVAEKIRGTLAGIAIAALDQPVTVSIGVGLVPEHGADPETVTRVADRALYVAKRSGRNRVEVAPAPGATTATPGIPDQLDHGKLAESGARALPA